MIRAALLILFLIFTSSLSAQRINLYGNADTTKIFAIHKYKKQIDSLSIKAQEMKLIPDSNEVEVSVRDYGNKIQTTNLFHGSRTCLQMTLYLKGCEVISVDVKEQSPIGSDVYRLSNFYLESDTIFYSICFSAVRSCLPLPLNKSISEAYGYNPDFTGESLKKYIRKLIFRIKNCSQQKY